MTDLTPRRPSGPHPSAEELYRASQGPRGAEAERVLAHAATCAACSEELLRLEAFDRPQPVPAAKLESEWERFRQAVEAPAAQTPATQPPAAMTLPWRAPRVESRRRRFLEPPVLALAATLAAGAVGLGLWWTARPAVTPAPAQEDNLRGTQAEDEDFSPAGSLAAPPEKFVFPAGDGAPQRVLLFEANGSHRWTSPPTAGGEVQFPEEERAKLRPGVQYLWTVLDGPTTIARSFRIETP